MTEMNLLDVCTLFFCMHSCVLSVQGVLAHSESLTSATSPLTYYMSPNNRWSTGQHFVFPSQQTEEVVEPAPPSTPRVLI